MSTELLKGIRVLDLTMAYAGPIGVRILADMGAEVIKIESVQRIDMPCRRISYPENQPGEDPWNRGGYFHRLNVNKLGPTINLNNPKGRDIFKRLVKVSDVVVENYSPRVMTNWGLNYEALKEIKPDIIMASMSIFGQTGPHKYYSGYMPNTEARAGLASITGYPGQPPMLSGTGYGDWVQGVSGAAGILMALYYRQRTGKGQYIDVSSVEAAMTHIGDVFMDYSMNGRVWPRMGNRHPSMAPHGLYRCKGEERWVTIACQTEEEWQNLCKVMGNPPWTKEERFSDPLSRWKNQDELDKLIEEWTKERDHCEVMHLLQQAGVTAGAVLDIKQIMLDADLIERGFFEVIDHPGGIGKRPHPKQMPAKFSEAKEVPARPAPFLGQHNNYVFKEILGMSEEEIRKLEEEQIIGSAPAKFPPGQEKPLPVHLMLKEGICVVDDNYLDELSAAYGTRIGPENPRGNVPSQKKSAGGV